MGLSTPELRFLALEHKRLPFQGRLLTLGRQCVYATLAETQKLLSAEGVDVASLPSDMQLGTNIPSWCGTPMERFTSDVVFFRLLGVSDVQALDCNDFEGAEIIADLNLPVSRELESSFDVIIDGGTSEHVFDIRQCLMNIASMLKPGGRIVHMSPSNNYANHGFYQISPTLFVDYYKENGFDEVRTYVANQVLRGDEAAYLDLYHFQAARQPQLMMSTDRRRILTICVARKGVQSSVDRIPVQSVYQELFQSFQSRQDADEEPETADIPRRWASRVAKRVFPGRFYRFIRGRWRRLQRRFPWRIPYRSPWGLEYWRRLD